MTRAVYIDATRAEVIAMCDLYGIPIILIEALSRGGVRIVLHNEHDAAILSKAYGDKVLTAISGGQQSS
jgi:hypothetical protein